MTVVENKWLVGPVRPDPRRRHRHRARGGRHAPDRAQRPLPPQRARTRSPPSTRPPTTGSSATAWCTACGSGRAGPTGTGPGWCAAPRCRELLGEEPAPGERHGGFDGANTNVIGLGRQDLRHRRGGRPAGGAVLRARHGVPLRPRAARCPTATPPTRRSTRPPGKLHAVAYHWALPHLQYIVIGADGARGAGVADRRHRRADGARLLDHRALDGRLRPARAVRPRRRDGRRGLPVRLEGRPPGPRRAHPARRRRRRRAVVRGGAVLRVPPAQRPRRRRSRRARRRALRPDVRRQAPGSRRQRAPAVALDARPHHRHRARGAARRPSPSSSRGSTSDWSAVPTAGATAPRCATTTSSGTTPSAATWSASTARPAIRP